MSPGLQLGIYTVSAHAEIVNKRSCSSRFGFPAWTHRRRLQLEDTLTHMFFPRESADFALI